MAEYEYEPGVCNIGPEEIQTRKNGIWAGLLATAAVITLIFLNGGSKFWAFAVFAPLCYVVINVLQVYYRFCVAYGMAGVFNLDSLGSKRKKVLDPEMIKKDRQKVFIMAAITLAVAGVLTLLFYGIVSQFFAAYFLPLPSESNLISPFRHSIAALCSLSRFTGSV